MDLSKLMPIHKKLYRWCLRLLISPRRIPLSNKTLSIWAMVSYLDTCDLLAKQLDALTNLVTKADNAPTNRGSFRGMRRGMGRSSSDRCYNSHEE